MINAAVVGLGWWGQNLVKCVQGQSDKIRFVKGHTRTLEQAQDFANEQGFELVPRYEDLLSDPNVDAIVLATPHSQHRAQIEAAAESGKHVFVEKPVTLYKADSEAVAKAAAKAGVVLAVGQNRRFHPSYIELKRMVDAGELGTILHLEGQMSAPGVDMYRPGSWRVDRAECPAGGMTGLGIHLVDAMIGLCGPIDWVYAQSFIRVYKEGLDDTTSALMRLRNGASAYVGTSIATAWCFSLRVLGDKGWAEIPNPALDKLIVVPKAGERQERNMGAFPTEKAELEAFAAAAEGGPAFPVTAEEFIHSTAVLRAIVDSAEREERVKIL